MINETVSIYYGMGFTDLQESTKRLHANWGWLLALGIGLSLFGILCLASAGAATLTAVALFGALLAISGALQILHAFSFRIGHGLLLSLLAGILYTVVGILMLARPGIGAVSLTLLLSGFFLVGGLFRCLWSAMIRYPSWGWAFFSGIVTLLLGVYTVANLPSIAVWMIGTLIGIEMLFNGWSWIMLSIAARAYEPAGAGASQTTAGYPRKVS